MDRSRTSLKVEGREVPLCLFRPAVPGPLPGLLYFHGGGFTSGSPEEAAIAAATLAESIPALVVAVGYALAPAHPFPAAIEDAHAAALWLAERAGPIGIVGHDAGGHVAVSLTLLARDRGGPEIAAQALLGPMLDPSLTRLAHGEAEDAGSATECARCYRAYLPEAALRLHPYAAPLESRRLGRLPPVLIATAQNDVLRPEAESYAARLIDAGVPTEVTRFAGVTHAGLARHPPALAATADFFRRRLTGAPSHPSSHR
ncbi:alpha/beta hydrolase fold domain-containing protein [Azospirillum sp. YIM B02556]|uniref:Alpha/beta hydrolase fold domain-containing protein n=1 Tax=Azospirillum endophyticum TaxID=2800326 RepID=A0ABS1F6M9_9PROT|nr:alpha/beta hydrolase [Azospirillum endophyticum]MBK1839084.1 alpha/beta hydrolase fold domain-containing protein [Azospirillum endophyticum]